MKLINKYVIYKYIANNNNIYYYLYSIIYKEKFILLLWYIYGNIINKNKDNLYYCINIEKLKDIVIKFIYISFL